MDEEDDEPQPDIDHIAYGFMDSKALFAALRASEALAGLYRMLFELYVQVGRLLYTTFS